MDLADMFPRSDEDKFLQSPYAERLEKLKPTIVKLYMENYGPGGKRMTMRQVIDFMRDKFSFYMSQNQLEHTLRKWNIRRRILNREKDEVSMVLGKRTRAGASTSDVALQEGKPVDKKQLKRHLQDKIRRHEVNPMAPGVLISWNLPYNALIKSIVRQPDMPSPFGDQSITPNYITVNSPKDATGSSPSATTSPSMQLIRQRLRQDQSNLLLQGNFKELFTKCGRDDRITLTNYMHEFWMHTFVTAKYWGRGPLLWTKEMITAMTLNSLAVLHSVPASPASASASSPLSSRDEPITLPTQHCRWVIHVSDEQTHYNWQDDQTMVNSDINLEESWSPEEHRQRSFPQSIQEAIAESTFTALPPEDVPVSNSLIAESLRKDPSSLQLESLRFAIIAASVELVSSLISANVRDPAFRESLKEIHPYHLAASYLDGGNTCCSLISVLCNRLRAAYPIAKHYADAMGHTVLDSVVVTIIRSHTRVAPKDVCPSFANTNSYPGEEKDTCGRWDADSPSIRQLFQRGKHRVPLNWKHPFCHSSVQAVCHSIAALFRPGDDIPYINRSSGIFVRYCSTCGAKLSLGALHSIVILAYHLADSGISGESLFGTVAILVCLLRLGADVSLKAEVSMHEILGVVSTDMCHHETLDADGFMQTVPLATVNRWSPECQTGWHCMRGILRLAKFGKIRRLSNGVSQDLVFGVQSDSMDISDDGDDDDDDDDDDQTSNPTEALCSLETMHDGEYTFPCGNPQLGLIWAVIQAEMLTHRKIDDTNSWMSDHFSMTALKKWLEGESEELDMPFVQEHMLKPYTPCGWFNDSSFPICTADEATKEHIMNMDTNKDLYHRASFHFQPDFYDS